MGSGTLRDGAAPDVRPLYAAGFVTAFGAHAVAAAWGAETPGSLLLQLGLLVAVYDLAEVLLKPVFGSLADRIGPRPVIVGGLLAFALVSAVGAVTQGGLAVILVRFGQGAAASAFSPAASAAVSRLAPPERRGRYFGRYGSWKGLGYAAGPLVGGVLASAGGIALLQLTLALLALVVAGWAAWRCPAVPPLPRHRSTLADVVRASTRPAFLGPVLLLAASAGTLVAAIGFLPARAASLHAGVVAAAATASVLALVSSVTQPAVGRLLDRGRLTSRWFPASALLLCAAGLAVGAIADTLPAVLLAAVLAGTGVATATPSAYATLAAATPAARMGRTMGTAEMGRELGDAGAPALVGVVAGAAGLASGLATLAGAVLLAAAISATITAIRSRSRALTRTP